MSVMEVTRTVKKWEVFPGKNKFCCNGRVITGNQPVIFYVTLFLIIIVTGLFFGSDCPYLAVNLSPAIPVAGILLFLFVISSLLRTSCTDPGIIPRATSQEADNLEKQTETTNSVGGRDMFQPPRMRELTINGVLIKLKYCPTCRIFRPPRASHCSVCDNCVERFDHHCPWVGNCIGKRNYRYFYLFLVSISLHCIFICGFSVTTLVLISLKDGFVSALQTSPGSIVEAVIAFFSLWSVIGLAGFHTFLAACNLTTNEDIKNAYSKSDQKNPFGRGSLCGNYCEVICGPTPPSLIDRRGTVVVDMNNQIQPHPVANGYTTNSLSPTVMYQTELVASSGQMT